MLLPASTPAIPGTSFDSLRAIGFVRIVLGALLLCAATLKAYALWSDTAQPVPLFSSFHAQVAIIEIEAFLGLWLLSGHYLHLAWLSATILFFALSSASLYLVTIGEVSCGCFGSLRVHPWFSFALDSSCLGLLVAFFPKAQLEGPLIRALPALARGLLGVGMLAAILVAASYMWFGSPQEALSYVRGDRIALEPSGLEFGKGGRAESKAAALAIWNRTDRTVRVLGGSANCSCVTTNDLPVVIPAHERKVISIRLMYPAETGFFARSAWLMTDDPIAQRLVLSLSGRVVADK
jgi:hypothetical protein